MTVYPVDELSSPVSSSELASYIGAEADDPVIPGCLIVASEMLIQHMQRDISPRAWRLVVKERAGSYPRIIKERASAAWLEVPFGATSITSVQNAAGDPLPFDADLNSVPARINVNTHELYQVAFIAGFDPVPDAIKEAVKALAAFLFEHRGSCDAVAAIKRSGAAEMVKRYRVERL